MSDPLSWSLSLGHWAGTRVRVHVFLLVFALSQLLGAIGRDPQGQAVVETTAWLSLLMLALVLHELGHVAWAARLGVERDDVRLWPLGNLVGPSTTAVSRSTESVLIALAGPVTSLSLALVALIGLRFVDATMVLNPFSDRGGTPLFANGNPATSLSAVWWVGWFGYLNWVIFLANLIPALPMDGGRVLRGILASQSRDGMIAPYVARVCGVVLGLWGVMSLWRNRPGWWILVVLAVLIEVMVRVEIRMFEEVGFFDDSGVFGYDFSQGYTSLDASPSTVRPVHESSLRRWRRRRSEQRRQRLEAKQAAEERRMDEILIKLHQQGRSALTDEEHRFLIRVSASIRNRRVKGSPGRGLT